MAWTSDPIWDAEQYAAEQDNRLRDRPVCDCCGGPVSGDRCFRYRGVQLCEECVEAHMEYIEEDEWA